MTDRTRPCTQRRHLALSLAVLVSTGLAGAFAGADELVLPLGSDAPSLDELPRPSRGMSSRAVLDRFGEPISMSAPVGDPPISRWRYDAFIVVFERDTVLHSVVPREDATD